MFTYKIDWHILYHDIIRKRIYNILINYSEPTRPVARILRARAVKYKISHPLSQFFIYKKIFSLVNHCSSLMKLIIID